MPIKISRQRLKVYLRLTAVVLFLVFLVSLLSRERREHMFSYFSTRCLDYRQKIYSRSLNDRVVDYIAAARLKGIKICNDEKELRQRVREGRLVRVRSTRRYTVEEMTYSYPYATKQTKFLLDEIGRRFNEKTSGKGLKRARFYVTSMTRLSETLKSLRKSNSNASANSPHLYGNAFDISYKRFRVSKFTITNCDEKFMKEALAEVIRQLRDEKKCWATYERGQSCFHIVAR
jgi:hypothetical protein